MVNTNNLPLSFFFPPSLSFLLSFSNLKKYPCESCELFYLEQNEDCILADSSSDSSEELLQRSRGEVIYMWFWYRGSACNQAHTHTHTHTHIYFFNKRFLLVSWRLLLAMKITMKDFSAFLDMRRYKDWAYKMVSWKYLTIWRPVLPVSSLPWAQSAPFLCSTLNSFPQVLKVSSCSSSCLILTGRW